MSENYIFIINLFKLSILILFLYCFSNIVYFKILLLIFN